MAITPRHIGPARGAGSIEMEIAEIVQALEEIESLRQGVESLHRQVESLQSENENLRNEILALRKKDRPFKERIEETDISTELKGILNRLFDKGIVRDEDGILENSIKAEERYGKRCLSEFSEKVFDHILDEDDCNVENIIEDLADGSISRYETKRDAWEKAHPEEEVVNSRYEDYFDWDAFLDSYFDEDEFIETDEGEFFKVSWFF